MQISVVKKFDRKLLNFLFNLRNKKYVRNHSINKKKIAIKNHLTWADNFFKMKNNSLYVIKEKKKFIGYLRSNKIGKFFNLSWHLTKITKRFGAKLLKKASNDKNKKYKAVIIKNNLASIKLAKKCGFKVKKNKRTCSICINNSQKFLFII